MMNVSDSSQPDFAQLLDSLTRDLPAIEWNSENLEGSSIDTASLGPILEAHFSGPIAVDRYLRANLDEDPTPEHLLMIRLLRDTIANPYDAMYARIDLPPPSQPKPVDYQLERKTIENRLVIFDTTQIVDPVRFSESIEDTRRGDWSYPGVFNDNLSSPAFFISTFHMRGGSGWAEYYILYRYDSGTYRQCGVLPVSLSLGGRCTLEPRIETTIAQSTTSRINVRFTYSLNADYDVSDRILEGSCSEQAINVTRGTMTINYDWDETTHTFLPQLFGTGMTPERFIWLTTICPEEESPAAVAYRPELEQMVQRGNECERATAEDLLGRTQR